MEKAKIDRAGFGAYYGGKCFVVSLEDLNSIRTDHEYVVGPSTVFGIPGVVAVSVVDGHILRLEID